MSDVTDKRGEVYGDYATMCNTIQVLKETIHGALGSNKRFHAMSCHDRAMLKEGLDMIAHKIGRIVNGDPTYLDNFVDIEGYSEITRKRICKNGE